MIDVLKRLAELDAQNPNIVQHQGIEEGIDQMVSSGHKIIANRKTPKGEFVLLQNKNDGKYEIHKFVGPASTTGYEFVSVHNTPEEMQHAFKSLTGVNESLEECGMMDSMGSMSQPHMPASINMTAASGEELSGMLKDIMSLAGLNKDSEMPVSSEPAAQTLEPAGPPEMDATTTMRSVIDKMNPADGEGDSEEEKVDEWDNESIPELHGEVPANQDPAGSPGAAQGRNMMGHPVAHVSAMEQQLMAEYKKFISEEQE